MATETATVKFEPLIDKFVKDGKTAVLTTSSWGTNIDMFRCDPNIINLMLEFKKYKRGHDITKEDEKYNDDAATFNKNINDKIIKYCHATYDYTKHTMIKFNFENLKIHWIPVGTFFRITHCGDNGESIITVQQEYWTKA